MSIIKELNRKHKKQETKEIVAIDLFCGAGGLTRGLEKSGIAVNLGIDIDQACEYPYTANNKANFLLKSVDDVEASELLNAFNGAELKLLAGCAPCQTFSSYNQKADSSDKRWWLLLQFSRLIEETEPELVTMENVPGLMDQDVFREFVENLEARNFHVDYKVVNCAEYGLPQQRNRLVLLASQLGPIKLMIPKEFKRKAKTVKEAIGKLPAIEACAIDSKDPLHQSSSLSETNYQRILVSKPGGSWRDWPEELVADCHKKKSGKTYPSVYGRMSWDEPAPTITTQFFGFGNGRFGHPEPISKKVLGRLIGNAGPVKLGELIGKSILKHVTEYNASVCEV